jgi:hypothetical protein
MDLSIDSSMDLSVFERLLQAHLHLHVEFITVRIRALKVETAKNL